MKRGCSLGLMLSILLAALVASGCGPSKANIELRKENQQLQQRVWHLERLREGDLQRITAIEQPTTLPTLPYSELQKLYTAHGLSFGSLTGGYKLNPNDAQYAGVAVYVVPTDEDGQMLKAAGSFDISVFDLAIPDKPLVAQRAFSLEESRQAWNGRALLYNYVLRVPFTTQPQHPNLLVRVQFTDGLTGRKIVAERQVKLEQ